MPLALLHNSATLFPRFYPPFSLSESQNLTYLTNILQAHYTFDMIILDET